MVLAVRGPDRLLPTSGRVAVLAHEGGTAGLEQAYQQPGPGFAGLSPRCDVQRAPDVLGLGDLVAGFRGRHGGSVPLSGTVVHRSGHLPPSVRPDGHVRLLVSCWGPLSPAGIPTAARWMTRPSHLLGDPRSSPGRLPERWRPPVTVTSIADRPRHRAAPVLCRPGSLPRDQWLRRRRRFPALSSAVGVDPFGVPTAASLARGLAAS